MNLQQSPQTASLPALLDLDVIDTNPEVAFDAPCRRLSPENCGELGKGRDITSSSYVAHPGPVAIPAARVAGA